mmetsp:Transcript_17850/g.42077  ORF Transcript_17850/g.42077 Transcript_17850/m.42077 type:complete len:227 (-) Transcript_17850:25-705(-)
MVRPFLRSSTPSTTTKSSAPVELNPTAVRGAIKPPPCTSTCGWPARTSHGPAAIRLLNFILRLSVSFSAPTMYSSSVVIPKLQRLSPGSSMIVPFEIRFPIHAPVFISKNPPLVAYMQLCAAAVVDVFTRAPHLPSNGGRTAKYRGSVMVAIKAEYSVPVWLTLPLMCSVARPGDDLGGGSGCLSKFEGKLAPSSCSQKAVNECDVGPGSRGTPPASARMANARPN